MSFCSGCGNKLDSNSSFCGACGRKVVLEAVGKIKEDPPASADTSDWMFDVSVESGPTPFKVGLIILIFLLYHGVIINYMYPSNIGRANFNSYGIGEIFGLSVAFLFASSIIAISASKGNRLSLILFLLVSIYLDFHSYDVLNGLVQSKIHIHGKWIIGFILNYFGCFMFQIFGLVIIAGRVEQIRKSRLL